MILIVTIYNHFENKRSICIVKLLKALQEMIDIYSINYFQIKKESISHLINFQEMYVKTN